MASVLRTESGFDPNALHVNGPGGGYIRPASREDAIVAAIDLIVVQRKSVDLGLGQINSGNLPALGITIADAFDPCKNLAASAKLLAAGYMAAAQTRAEPQSALRAALSQYNTGDPVRGIGNGYVGRVEQAARYLVPEIAALPPAVGGAAPQADDGTAIVAPVRSTPLPPAWDVFADAAVHRGAVFGGVLPGPSPALPFPPRPPSLATAADSGENASVFSGAGALPPSSPAAPRQALAAIGAGTASGTAALHAPE